MVALCSRDVLNCPISNSDEFDHNTLYTYLQVIFTINHLGNVQSLTEAFSSFLVLSNNQIVLTDTMETHSKKGMATKNEISNHV